MCKINLVSQYADRVYVSVYDSNQPAGRAIRRVFPQGERLPGAGGVWHQADCLKQLAQKHGFGQPHAWCIAYPLDPAEPGRAERYARLFEQAGLGEVYMVPDVDAVMAFGWLQRGGSAIQPRQGVMLVDREEEATTVTLIRMEQGKLALHRRTAAPDLPAAELANLCGRAWAIPDLTLFYGSKGADRELVGKLRCRQYSCLELDWTPHSLQTGMEQLAQGLARMIPLSHAWNALEDPNGEFARTAKEAFDRAVAAPILASADTLRNMERAMESWAGFCCRRNKIVDRAVQLHRQEIREVFPQWHAEIARSYGWKLGELAQRAMHDAWAAVELRPGHHGFLWTGDLRQAYEQCMTGQLIQYLLSQYENYRPAISTLGMITSGEARHRHWRDLRGRLRAIAEPVRDGAKAYIFRVCDFSAVYKAYLRSVYRGIAGDFRYELEPVWSDMALSYDAMLQKMDHFSVRAVRALEGVEYTCQAGEEKLPKKLFPMPSEPECVQYDYDGDLHRQMLAYDDDYRRMYEESHLP